MNSKTVIIMIVLVVIVVLAYGWFSSTPDAYSFDGGQFSYSPREIPRYAISLYQKNESFDIYAVSIPTRPLLLENVTLRALLVVPHHAAKEKLPSVVLLPGGGGTKESRLPFAEAFVSQGYATLVLDQRGIGQTGGTYLAPEQDYLLFAQGKEPLQHLAVYDALTAFDVLASLPYVDAENILFAGESMGGRYALIAAALETKSAGVVAISASGFHIPDNSRERGNDYLRSIDPDRYIADVAPHPLVMIHDAADNVIPLADAQQSFSLANEPKLFIQNNDGCKHGFCPAMTSAVRDALEFIEETRGVRR